MVQMFHSFENTTSVISTDTEIDNVPAGKKVSFESLHSPRRQGSQCSGSVRSLSTVIRRELVDVDEFFELGLPLGPGRDDVNLGRRTGIEPSLDDPPSSCEEDGRVDDDHLVHGLGVAEGVDLGLLLDDSKSLATQLGRREVGQIQHSEKLEVLEVWVFLLLCPQTIAKVVHHDEPMELENSLEVGDALHSLHVENTGLGDEQWDTVLGKAGVQLRVLSVIQRGIAPKCSFRVGVEVLRLGIGANFRRLFNHLHDIVDHEFTTTEPSAQRPALSLFLTKAVDRVLEITAPLLHFCLELALSVHVLVFAHMRLDCGESYRRVRMS